MLKKKKAPQTADAAAPAPKGRKKLLIAVVVLAALSFVGYSKVLKAPAAAEEPAAEETVEEGEIIDVAVLTANLAGAELHYARVGISAVLSTDAVADAVAVKAPLLKDAALSEIQSSTPQQLRTVKGVDDLRRRIGKRAQQIWPDGEVVRVVFTEFLVQ